MILIKIPLNQGHNFYKCHMKSSFKWVPSEEQEKNLAVTGLWRKAIWEAIRPGLYAVIGTLVIAVFLCSSRLLNSHQVYFGQIY